MSWSELQRLVEEAEADGAIRRGLRHCRSRQELLLACRRLGYAIEAADLCQARALERSAQDRPDSGPSAAPFGSASPVASRSDAAPAPRRTGATLAPTVNVPIAS